MSVGVRTAYQAVFGELKSNDITRDELTPLERENLGITKLLDEVLRVNYSETTKIFTELKDEVGMPLGWGGFWSPTTRTVSLRRSTLSNVWNVVNIYTHEVGHAVTGDPDPADTFRAFFEVNLTSLLLGELKRIGAKFHTPQIPLNYAAELKNLGAEQIRLAAMRQELIHEKESTVEERSKLDEKYREEMQHLRDKLRKTEEQLSFEERKRWYEKTDWYQHLKQRKERKRNKGR
jgi:hypothetical protein